jgi:transcriptional regulator with XRE-family HTH domain
LRRVKGYGHRSETIQSPAGDPLDGEDSAVSGSGLGDRVRRLRVEQRLSQADLAARVGVTPSYLSLVESGRRHPRLPVVERVSAALGCSPDFLRTGRLPSAVRSTEVNLRFAELALRSGDPRTARTQFAEVWQEIARHDGVYAAEVAESRWGMARADEALGNLEAAIEGFEWLLTIDLPPTIDETPLRMKLCHAYLECGDLTRAVEVGEEALARFDGVLDTDEAVEMGSTLVLCYRERGDLTSAYLLAQRVIAAAEDAGSLRARGAAYWNAAIVAQERGDLRSALALSERAVALYAEGDNLRALAGVRLTAAWVLLEQPTPRHEEAAALLSRAHEDFIALGNAVDIAMTETELARCELHRGRAEEAVDIASTAIGRLATGPRLEAARARTVLAQAQLRMGEARAAIASYQEAAVELERVGAARGAAALWRELAEALQALDLTDLALTAYRKMATTLVGREAAGASVTGRMR